MIVHKGVEEFFKLRAGDPAHCYECIDGEIYMMTGGSKRYSRIGSKNRILGNVLRDFADFSLRFYHPRFPRFPILLLREGKRPKPLLRMALSASEIIATTKIAIKTSMATIELANPSPPPTVNSVGKTPDCAHCNTILDPTTPIMEKAKPIEESTIATICMALLCRCPSKGCIFCCSAS